MTYVRQFRKMLAVLLLAFMALTICFGWQGTAANAANNGSITVTNANNGMTYEFYRILDLELGNGVDNTAGVSYSIPDKYTDIWNDSGYLNATNQDGALKNTVSTSGGVKYLNVTPSNVAQFSIDMARALKAASLDPETSQTASNGTASASDLALGYYLVVPVGGEMPSGEAATPISLTSADPNGEITSKGVAPSITKTVDEEDNSADVGDTVTYTITGTVPAYTDSDKLKIFIGDTMSGLNLTGNYDIKVDNESVKNNGSIVVTDKGSVTVGEGTNKATIENYLNNMKVPTNGEKSFCIGLQNLAPGQKYVITYDAIVGADAVRGPEGNTNSAMAIFSHDPSGVIDPDSDTSDDSTSQSDIDIYVYDVNIEKVIAGSDEPLADAQFVLYKQDNGIKYYKVDTDTGAVSWVDIGATDPLEAAEDGTISMVKTDGDGLASFDGVQVGTYYVQEVVAPTGYNLLDEAQEVQIDSETAADFAVTVENSAGSLLPETGGMGTTLFYLVGICLMAGAVVIFVKSRKKNNDV